MCVSLLQDVPEEDIEDDEVRMAAMETDRQSGPATTDANEPLTAHVLETPLLPLIFSLY